MSIITCNASNDERVRLQENDLWENSRRKIKSGGDAFNLLKPDNGQGISEKNS